jgi:hypothetical protein
VISTSMTDTLEEFVVEPCRNVPAAVSDRFDLDVRIACDQNAFAAEIRNQQKFHLTQRQLT